MTHTKRRIKQHIMEEQSYEVLRALLPSEWVIRKYSPDYGLDANIEIFDTVIGSADKADTCGEHLFVQLKSVETIVTSSLCVKSCGNVEKSHLQEDNSESCALEVIKYDIDTNELRTIQAMGAGLPVILFLVGHATGKVYYLCLNDYLEKILIPEDPAFAEKEHKTIYIPVANEITKDPLSLHPLRFYAKRPKLYAAFSTFRYQANELEHLCSSLEDTLSADWPSSVQLLTIRHFLKVISCYDFWNTTPQWKAIEKCHANLTKVDKLLTTIADAGVEAANEFIGDLRLEEGAIIRRFNTIVSLHRMWRQLTNLNNIYEEFCREWHLPTYLANELLS